MWPIPTALASVSWGCCNKRSQQNICFNSRNVGSHSSGGYKSKIKVPAWSFPGEDSLSGLYTAAFPLCPYVEEREKEEGWASTLGVSPAFCGATLAPALPGELSAYLEG